MKINRLEITGFGPFRDMQTIDLERYAGDGIFLIAGRTGAGKSSILDAICFALYGTTPRYSESEKRLRSDYAEPGEPTSVLLEFEVGDGAWRIERRPEYERPAKRGGGMTTQRSSVELFERDGAEWRGIASKEKEANARISDIVGMTAGQFQQVILLAQGRFARFLLAKNDERLVLLRSLFGTRRFAEYETALDERRRAVEAEVGEQTEGLRLLLDQTQELIERALTADAPEGMGEADDPDERGDGSADATDSGLSDAAEHDAGTGTDGADDASDAPAHAWAARVAEVSAASDAASERRARAEEELERAAAVSAAAERADDERRAMLDRLKSRDLARGRIAVLDAERDVIEAARAELDAAQRAAGMRTALEAAQRAEAAAADAQDDAERAREEWGEELALASALDESGSPVDDVKGRTGAERGDPPGRGSGSSGGAELGSTPDGYEPLPAADAPRQELDAFAARAQTQIGVWEPVRVIESELASGDARIGVERAGLAERKAALVALDERRAALPGHIHAARTNHDEAENRAEQAGAVDDDITALEAQLTAAREVGERTRAYAEAEERVRVEKHGRDAAEHALGDLHLRRLAGYSGELAERLTDGEPCAVCGSTNHPAPAEPADDRVTPEQVDEAEDARAAAIAAYETVVDARQQADLLLRDAQQRSGGRTETEVNGDLIAAEQRRSDAAAAARRVDRFAVVIAELESEREALDSKRGRASADIAALEATLTAHEERLAEERATAATARGAYASVAERIGAARRLVSRARACVDAASVAEHAARSARSAREALAVALDEAELASVADALSALRTAEHVAALTARVRAADDARGAAERTLAELAELDLPAWPVDRSETVVALTAAREAYTRAVDARAETAQLAVALGTALERASIVHAQIGEKAAKAEVVARLANSVAGRAPNDRRMNLETFVLAAELEEIVQAANLRLAAMSDNRYTLRHTDAVGYRYAASGLGIEVFDAHTGRARPPQSLSGGETFLASLALALGLAEVVTGRSGGIRLDTLFIDEGFGSLDSETLEVAMRTLDDLRQGGRTVGLISHVESMKEQVTAQLRVEQAPQGWSYVRQE